MFKCFDLFSSFVYIWVLVDRYTQGTLIYFGRTYDCLFRFTNLGVCGCVCVSLSLSLSLSLYLFTEYQIQDFLIPIQGFFNFALEVKFWIINFGPLSKSI